MSITVNGKLNSQLDSIENMLYECAQRGKLMRAKSLVRKNPLITKKNKWWRGF